jgi:hypothetical protein
MKKLLLVCDDAGFAAVDRGIRAIADATGKPLCAEYLILGPGAIERAKDMSAHPLVSIGLHFELAGVSDADRVALANDLKARGTVLGELPGIREKASADARTQLEVFRDALGRDPAHVSTHGDFNVDASGAVMPWWTALMDGLFGGDVPPMQWANPHVRHNKYSWNLDATKRAPCTPDEFETVLREQTSDVVEFVMHPALPEPGDASIDMLFSAEMRVRDVEAAIAIIASGCIEKAGYRVTPVSAIG